MTKQKRAPAKSVELVRTSYQPTKAEKEEEFALRAHAPDNLTARMEQVAQVLVQPVNVRWIDKPRNRRPRR